MKNWDLTALEVEPRTPRILSSSPAARVVVLQLSGGERLQDHEVHERAWLLVRNGEIEVTAANQSTVSGGPGSLFEFDPQERHEVVARSDASLLLVLAPWPGDGHPGSLTLDQKASARARAAEHARQAQPSAGPS